MAPTIHIIRHAQAVHNVTRNFKHNAHLLPDPELTELGYQQCATLAAELASLSDIELVFASPMQRTIQTALATFKTYTQSKRIVLLPDLKECDSLPTSVGSSPDDLFRKFGDECLDFSFVTPDWTDNSPQSRYGPMFAAARGRSTRLFLRSVAQRYRDTDANIVVVTHGLYVGYLTRPGAGLYKNAEYRSYYFEQLTGDDIEARLIEKPREKAKSAPKPELPSIFGLDLPAFGPLQTNAPEAYSTSMPGTLPSGTRQTRCGGPGPISAMTVLPAFQDMQKIIPTIEEPGDEWGIKPQELSPPRMNLFVSKPAASSKPAVSSKPVVPSKPAISPNLNITFPKNSVTKGSLKASLSNPPNIKTIGTPLFNTQNKKQKTTETSGAPPLFKLPGPLDPPGKKTNEFSLFDFSGKNSSDKTTWSLFGNLPAPDTGADHWLNLLKKQ
ncbi:histidine phosphatase superfamily [Xylaria castorea]|nr:histidine phosphatase superfamily [Xylaria castorea]